MLAARGKDEHDVPQGGSGQMLTTYRETRRVLRLPSVRSLGLVLLTMRAPLAAFEALVPLELVKLGVPKEKLAAMNTVMLPVSMATQVRPAAPAAPPVEPRRPRPSVLGGCHPM